MMQKGNFHSHSNFSDGYGSPEMYVQNAIEQNLIAYGISDHAPIPLEGVGPMEIVQLTDYLAKIEQLQGFHQDKIQIYKSLEVDYIPDVISIDSAHILDANLDYTIGAVHYVDYLDDGTPWGFEGSIHNFERGLNEIFQGDIQACISRYYELIIEMITNHTPDIVAHIDRIKKLNIDDRYFSEKEPWYRDLVISTLEKLSLTDAIMEINTKGYYKREIEETYPGSWVIGVAHELGIPMIVGSDAHHPDDIIKGFKYANTILRKIGVKSTRIFVNNRWQNQSLRRKEYHLV